MFVATGYSEEPPNQFVVALAAVLCSFNSTLGSQLNTSTSDLSCMGKEMLSVGSEQYRTSATLSLQVATVIG